MVACKRKSEVCVRTEGRYHQATGLSRRHPLKEVECIQGHPLLVRSRFPVGEPGRDFEISIGPVKTAGAVATFAALVRRRAGRVVLALLGRSASPLDAAAGHAEYVCSVAEGATSAPGIGIFLTDIDNLSLTGP
jgi:hypothetical protein